MGEEAVMDEKGVMAQHGLTLQENGNTGPLRWWDCEDLEIFDDVGRVMYAGPRYYRCTRAECTGLVTVGMIQTGGCFCGNRRVGVALRLTKVEKERLSQAYYPLVSWEWAQIEPVCPEGKEPGWGKADFEDQYA